MPAIAIEAHDQAVQQALAALTRRIGNVGAALGLVGEEMLERIDRRFDTESGPDGARSAPIRAATKRRKRGSKMLNESGDLRGSITRQVAGAALTLGAHEPHAAMHGHGGAARQRLEILLPLGDSR